METLSPNFLCASSTEGASKLHRPQPGAQNHIAIGCEVGPRDRSIVPPPINEKVLALPATDDDVVALRKELGEELTLFDAEHPTNSTAPTTHKAPDNFLTATTLLL
jgi:hypothetical protein